MSSLPSLVIARLVGTAPFVWVKGAREFGAALGSPPVDKMPAAFVLPYAERYAPNHRLNRLRQAGKEQVTIAVMAAVKPAIGADVHDPLEAPRAALVTRLLGWQPETEQGELELVSGALTQAEPTHLTWQFVFQRDRTVAVSA